MNGEGSLSPIMRVSQRTVGLCTKELTIRCVRRSTRAKRALRRKAREMQAGKDLSPRTRTNREALTRRLPSGVNHLGISSTIPARK